MKQKNRTLIENLQRALKAIELISCYQIEEKKTKWDDVYMIAHSWSNCKGHEEWKKIQDDIIKEIDN